MYKKSFSTRHLFAHGSPNIFDMFYVFFLAVKEVN